MQLAKQGDLLGGRDDDVDELLGERVGGTADEAIAAQATCAA